MKELKTINELNGYKFSVPSYQRGYRWEKRHVEALLNDILEFSKSQDSSEFYCLQPLVVKANGEESIDLDEIKKKVSENKIKRKELENLLKECENSEYIVIDGQQRLTTIYLILKELENDKFSLEYERDNMLEEKFDDKICYENADSFYLSSAIKTIKEWLKNNKEKEKFKDTLLNRVKVIWHEINQSEKETFGRINSGKIPLTNAELIKATLINNCENQKDKIELAKEWDEIEYYLQNDEVWGFLTKSEKYPTRIELIFEICLNEKHNDDDKYKTFNALKDALNGDKNNKKDKNRITYESYEKFWQDVKRIFLTLRYWFEDYEIYHLVGFLVATGEIIQNIYKETKDKTKSEFKKYLKGKIKEKIKGKTKDKIKKDKLEKLKYDENKQDITNILLLFNIATILNSGSNFTRFSFDKFNSQKWSLEHIHARNDKGGDGIRGFEKQKEWLNEAEKYLLEEKENLRQEIKKFTNENDDENFQKLYKEIMEYFGESSDPIDTIDNLALLSANLNSSLNNSVFPVKREKIKEMDQSGKFIPICTKNVFMKYYSNGNNEVFDRFKWTNSDMEKYQNSIIETLNKFFGEEK